jgi:hypothetical protein
MVPLPLVFHLGHTPQYRWKLKKEYPECALDGVVQRILQVRPLPVVRQFLSAFDQAAQQPLKYFPAHKGSLVCFFQI